MRLWAAVLLLATPRTRSPLRRHIHTVLPPRVDDHIWHLVWYVLLLWGDDSVKRTPLYVPPIALAGDNGVVYYSCRLGNLDDDVKVA